MSVVWIFESRGNEPPFYQTKNTGKPILVPVSV